MGSFDNLDHEVLLHILGEKIHDNRFLRLVANMLKAGYLEEWRYNATLSGSPQGGVISPILSNIYLDKLDAFVVTNLSLGYNAGDARKRNPEYADLMKRRRNLQRHGRHEDAAHLLTQMHTLQSRLPDDPDYRRLRYIRYADDFLLGFDGPKEEAREIKEHLRRFLRDTLKLELSGEKTLITHAATERARFLGYELYTQWHAMPTQGKRSVNGKIGFNVPKDVTDGAIKKYMVKGKPIHRNGLLADSDFAIVRMYQSEYRGLVNYYVLAHNIHNFGQVQYVTETSLLKTLAAKHKASLMDMVRKYKAMTETPYGQMKCLRVVVNRDTEGKPPLVAEFGGIPLRRQRRVTQLDDTPQPIWAVHTDLLSRLLAQQCEMCGQKAEGTAPNIQVHHIRKMADLKKPGRKELSEWQRRMIGLRRKTLIVCHSCHVDIHAGRPMRQRQRRPA